MSESTNQPITGTAWSSGGGGFTGIPYAASDSRPPLTLTLTGSEEEIRAYLDGPRLASLIHDLDEDLRREMKDGNSFKNAKQAFGYVRELLAEVREA